MSIKSKNLIHISSEQKKSYIFLFHYKDRGKRQIQQKRKKLKYKHKKPNKLSIKIMDQTG